MKMANKYDDRDLVNDLACDPTYIHSGDDVHCPIRRPRWRFRAVGARYYRRLITRRLR